MAVATVAVAPERVRRVEVPVVCVAAIALLTGPQVEAGFWKTERSRGSGFVG